MKRGTLWRDDACVVPHAMGAFDWWSRLRGLLGRPPLAADGSEALVLAPCASVHTIGMTYALDLVFLDGVGRVVGIHRRIPPWRTCGARDACTTVEFQAGALERVPFRLGETISWRDD